VDDTTEKGAEEEFAKHMEIRVYTTVKDIRDQWLALKREFEFVEVFAGIFPDKEKSAIMISFGIAMIS
jgi:hypothetical protein